MLMKYPLITIICMLIAAGCGDDGDKPRDEEISSPGEDTETSALEDTETGVELCGPEDILEVMDGEYFVFNNVWGQNENVGEQCIFVKDNGFEITYATHGSATEVCAYPFVLKGCHFGNCTEDSGMPVAISEISVAEFSWEIEADVPGCWNAAYESWFSDPDTGRIAVEMMIWMDFHGPAIPTGSVTDTVALGGYTWDIWEADNGWSYYIAYVNTESAHKVDLDLTEFIDDAVSRGVLSETDVLEAMEAGFELWWDGEGLKTVSFNGTVE